LTESKTGLPIANVPFPSVVLCSQGISGEGILAASYKLVFDYAKKTYGISTKVSPLELINFKINGVSWFETLLFVLKTVHLCGNNISA